MTKTIRRTLLTLAIAAASFTPLVASAQGAPTQDVFRPSASTTADGWRDFGGGYSVYAGQPAPADRMVPTDAASRSAAAPR